LSDSHLSNVHLNLWLHSPDSPIHLQRECILWFSQSSGPQKLVDCKLKVGGQSCAMQVSSSEMSCKGSSWRKSPSRCRSSSLLLHVPTLCCHLDGTKVVRLREWRARSLVLPSSRQSRRKYHESSGSIGNYHRGRGDSNIRCTDCCSNQGICGMLCVRCCGNS
jgi:hypothetical protein